MQVILLDDLERIGHEGDIINVADGFARNYLFPRNLAVKATKGTLKDLERRAKSISTREVDKRVSAQKIADELSAHRVTVKARAGQGVRLHGQVTPQMIAEAARVQLNTEIDRRDIDITESIRELGDYLISVKIYKEVAAQLPVSVVRDGEEEQAAPVAAPAPKPEPAAEEAEEVEEETAAE